MKDIEEIYQDALTIIDKLSKDELLYLRHKLRLLGKSNEAKYITKFIRKRKKEEPKKYRERKEKILIKEMEKVMKDE